MQYEKLAAIFEINVQQEKSLMIEYIRIGYSYQNHSTLSGVFG